VTDRNSGTIIEILDDRKKAPLKELLDRDQSQVQAVRSVSMDTWEPFINAYGRQSKGLVKRSASTVFTLWPILERH
jgi:transposase